MTLIALHHGELALPKVIITPLPIAGEMTMGSVALPSLRTYQEHDAETVLVLPRGGRSTFVLGAKTGRGANRPHHMTCDSIVTFCSHYGLKRPSRLWAPSELPEP